MVAAATGCGEDPIEQRAAELAAQSSSASPSGPGQPPPPGGSPGRAAGAPGEPGVAPGGLPGTAAPDGPGVPDEPPPGVPDEPPPGQPLGDNGPTITLSGTIALADWSGAPIRVDVFDGDQRDLDGPRPSVVGVARLAEPGAWSVSVSASIGQLWVGGYADDNQDGKPDHNEPVGWYGGNPVAGGAAQTGIALSLTVQPPE